MLKISLIKWIQQIKPSTARQQVTCGSQRNKHCACAAPFFTSAVMTTYKRPSLLDIVVE
jgi:hypothetical protein